MTLMDISITGQALAIGTVAPIDLAPQQTTTIAKQAFTALPSLLNANQLGSDRQTNWALPPNLLGSGAK